MLELKDATLTIHERQYFKRLSFMAMAGQLTCITGPSGAGKTLLVRVMLGFIPLDEGMVNVNGSVLTPLSAPIFRKMMAYLPQPEKPLAATAFDNTDGMEAAWGVSFVKHPQESLLRAGTSSIATELPSLDREATNAAIVVADDPPLELLGQLKAMADNGRVVVVATEREEYLKLSDKTIILGNNHVNTLR